MIAGPTSLRVTILYLLYYCIGFEAPGQWIIKAIQMKGLGTVSLIWSRQYFVLKTEIIDNTSVLIWWVHGCTVGVGWTRRHRRHLLHERCRVYRGGGGRWRGPDQRREAVLDKHTGSHPPAMEQNVVIFIWWKICLDIEVHCVNNIIYCLSTRLVCILCRYLVSNVQLVCKLSTDHALLCGITKVLPYWWDIYWYWSCATAAHSRVRTVVSSSTICKGILSLDIFYDI